MKHKVFLEWQLFIGMSMAIWLIFSYKWNTNCVGDTFLYAMVYNLNNQYMPSISQNSIHESCICNITHCVQRTAFINMRSGNVSDVQLTQWASVILPVTWLLFLGYEFILSEANLSYEAKPSAINLPNLNINSYPKNMSPCNDFITYFFVDEMDIFTRLSRASIATYAIRLFTAWVINQSERGKSIKYVITIFTGFNLTPKRSKWR